MSFALYINTVDEPFTEREILEAFGESISTRPDGALEVRYDAENESIIDCAFTPERTTSYVSVHRPCGDDRLFDALHRLLSARPAFLTYPDEDAVCIVASVRAADAIREKYSQEYPDLVEALKICSTAQELIIEW